jgi:hypothetical protein
MYALNNNNEAKQYQRFMDINEPLTMMTPIRGYDQMPLVPLEQAVQPLVPFIPEVQQMAHITKARCKNPPPDSLTVDQSAAIMLYTLGWEPKESSVYYILNAALRKEDRQVLKPWFLYLKLFFTALSLLPSTPRTVFRGMKRNEKHRYKKGEKVVWWGFSSCTSKMDVLNNEAFLGASGERTFFTIECQSGKDIQQHSYFKSENEVLLPAAREFKVESILSQPGGLNMIQLKETQPKYPLIESFSTINQLVQSFAPSDSSSVQLKTSAEPVSYNSVFEQPIQTSQSNIIFLSAMNYQKFSIFLFYIYVY